MALPVIEEGSDFRLVEGSSRFSAFFNFESEVSRVLNLQTIAIKKCRELILGYID